MAPFSCLVAAVSAIFKHRWSLWVPGHPSWCPVPLAGASSCWVLSVRVPPILRSPSFKWRFVVTCSQWFCSFSDMHDFPWLVMDMQQLSDCLLQPTPLPRAPVLWIRLPSIISTWLANWELQSDMSQTEFPAFPHSSTLDTPLFPHMFHPSQHHPLISCNITLFLLWSTPYPSGNLKTQPNPDH